MVGPDYYGPPYYCFLALSSLVTCNEKTKEKNDKKEKMKHEHLWIRKGKPKTYTSSTRTRARSWEKRETTKKKEKKNGIKTKQRTSQKAKRAENFGKVSQQVIPRRQLRAEKGLRD